MNLILKSVIIVIVLMGLLIFISVKISGLNSDNSLYDYNHSWTKAICNETHCQDYVIYCDEGNFVRQSPITGAVISIPEGWIDPREEKMRERICE